MIRQGIPVIVCFNTASEDASLSFWWKTENNDESIVIGNRVLWKADWLHTQSYFDQKGHYFVVTGTLYDSINDEYYFRVSSWGMEFYVNVEDFIGNTSRIANDIGTGYFYAEK